MEGDWLTIGQLAEQAGLPENTARRYASVFRTFFPARLVGRVKKYPMESLGILLRISKLSKQGLATAEITEALQQEYPQTVETNSPPDSPHHPTTTSSPAILHTLTRIAETLDRLEQHQEDVARLRAEVEHLRHEQDELRKTLTAQSSPSWWRRLLGKPKP